jgi:hypothetical protein
MIVKKETVTFHLSFTVGEKFKIKIRARQDKTSPLVPNLIGFVLFAYLHAFDIMIIVTAWHGMTYDMISIVALMAEVVI